MQTLQSTFISFLKKKLFLFSDKLFHTCFVFGTSGGLQIFIVSIVINVYMILNYLLVITFNSTYIGTLSISE